jgi:hypothetical protein
MAIKQRSYAITVGTAQALSLAQGEDCRFLLTFTEPAAPVGSGAPVDFTGLASCVLTVRDTSGLLLVARSGSVSGAATNGTLLFQFGIADTQGKAVQDYLVDVQWTDASGYVEQLLVASTFSLLRSVAAAGDTPTPAPTP